MRKLRLSEKMKLAFNYPGSALNFILSNYLDWKRIRLITFFITEKCNLSCPGCLVKETLRGGSLSFDHFKKVISELKSLKPFLYFTGGEPLLNEDIFKMVSYADRKKYITSLTTNGINLLEKYNDMLDSGLKFLSISVDGFEKEHDKMRGMKGAFNKTMKGLRKLINERDGKFPHIMINTVINRENYHQLYNLVTFLFNLGVDGVSLQHYSFYTNEIKEEEEKYSRKYSLGTSLEGDRIESLPYLNENQIRVLKNELRKIRNTNLPVNLRPQVSDITKYYLGYWPSSKSNCNRISKEVVIRSSGEIELCPGYVIGNIKKGLKESFAGEKAEKMRDHIARKGLIPACFRCCALNYVF